MALDRQTASQGGPTQAEGQRLDALEARVLRLERELGVATGLPHAAGEDPAEGRSSVTGTAEWLPLVGRTLLILGGAFVLRAVTESELLRPSVGVVLGIVYALVWLIAADRAGVGGRSGSATWLGVGTALIAYPLLWEATVTFRFLTAAQAAVAVTVVSALVLAVVWRHRLVGLAWVVTAASVTTLLGMAVVTRLPAMFTLCLLLVGGATLWLGYLRDIRGPARFVAISASLAVAMLGAIVLLADQGRRVELIDVGAVLLLQFGLIAVYVGSAIARTLVRGRALHVGEMVTGVTAAVVGLGGALLVARGTGTGELGLGLVAGAFGVAGYWATFTLSGLSEQRANFVFFSSLALVFVLVALSVSLSSVWLVAALAVGSVAMAWAGAARVRATLSLHGSVYAAAAAIASGVLAHTAMEFGLHPTADPGPVTVPMLIALAGALGYCGFAVATRERNWGVLARLPKFIVITVAAVGLGGIALASTADLLPRAADGPGPNGAALAVLRTAVLAISAVALAWAARFSRLHQAAWLVYPVLLVGGAKILLEDLRAGGAGTLVASFAVFGGALIVAPRLLRRLHRGRAGLDRLEGPG